MKIRSNQQGHQGQQGSFIRLLAVILLSCTSAILFASSFRAAPGKSPKPAAPLIRTPTQATSPPAVPAATLIVTTTADSGPGSLRQALADAQDGDTIQFDPALNGQTITLTTGELVINKNTVISGPGPGLLAVSRSSASQFRIFHALAGHTVVVEGLTISGGDVHNGVVGCGGGILNDGATSTINNCTISGNRGFDGGGICSNDGSLTIANSSIDSNHAGSGSSGGSGGGIYHSGGSLELSKSIVTNNTGINYGGGVMSAGGTSTIIDSTIRSNTTLLGGGIEIGGLSGGTGDVRNSTISDNTAAAGGGVGTSSGATLTISNSTLSGNFANVRGGGIINSGALTMVEIASSTISGNGTNGDGGGIFNDGAVQVGNTILQTGAVGTNIFNNGTVVSQGYNLSSDNGGGFLTGPGDLINTNPNLGPLQNNGGPTFTHALLPGSPAMNAGDPNFTPPPLYDQRGVGYDRVSNGRLDIGSFEMQSGARTPTPTATGSPSPVTVSLPVDTLDTSVPPPTVFLKPVTTTTIDPGLAYIAFRGDFTFDETVCTFSPDFVEPAGLTASNWNVSANILPGPGPIRTFRVSAFSLDFTPLSGSGTLYNLRMLRVSGTPGAGTALTWAAAPNNFLFNDSQVPAQENGLITITGTPVTPTATPTATPSCPPVLTQSTSQAITTPAPLCANPPPMSFPYNNSYWRAFNMQQFVGGAEYTVSSVSFGVFLPSAPVTIRLYANNGATFPAETGTLIGTSTLDVTSGGGTVVTTPLVATIPAGTNELVMELYEPEGSGFLRAGANTAPETGPSYWSSLDQTGCSSTPQVISSHLVFNIYGSCSPGTPTPTVSPTTTPTPTATPCAGTIVWSENFDGLPVGTPGPCAYISNIEPDTPPNDLFIADGSESCIYSLGNIAIPTATSVLRFRNNFNELFAAGIYWHGGVLEVSSPNISGGDFLDITDSHVGGSFVAGGYTGEIDGGAPNPLAGRMVWSGNSGGYINTVVNLGPNLAGQTVSLRLRFGSDGSGGAPGWRVDTMSITDGSCSTPTPSATPTATATATPCTGTIVWSENFDGLPAGTPGPCSYISNIEPDTPPNDLFIADGSESCVYSLGNIAIPTATSVLRFRNNFNELFSGGAFWHGGVLEVSTPSISGGDFLDITDSHVGGSFVTGGYTGQIDGLVNNPLAGRMAWVGNSNGYIDTIIRLGPNLAGQFVSFRLFFGSDGFDGGAPGWRVDTMSITDGICPTPTPTPSPTATATAMPARSLNLSTRMLVQTGDQVGIGGFIITGSAPKDVLLRAIGPSLAAAGVPNPLADPVMELHGSAGFTTMTNDNWRDTQEAEIIATGIPPSDNLESAIVATLAPGAYTAIVKGKNDTSGVGLVEVYDLGPASSQLANISTRAFVGTGTDVLIGGFILGGDAGTATVLIRGIGPSLAASGLSPVLADPTLELRDNNGVLVASNDNCGESPPGPPFPPFPGPTNPQESCIGVTLQPGLFTTILAGKDGGTGVGLVEIYNLQ